MPMQQVCTGTGDGCIRWNLGSGWRSSFSSANPAGCGLPRDKLSRMPINAQLPRRPFRAVGQTSCRPYGGIRPRNAGKPGRTPDNGALDISRTRQHIRRRVRRKTGRSCRRPRCLVPYSPQPNGRFGRSRYPGRCSVPSFLGQAPAGRIPRSSRTRPHRRCRRRYTIETVD